MSRLKLIALIVFLTIIVILIILFFKIPGFPDSLLKKQSSPPGGQSSSQVSKIPTPEGLVQGAKDYLANQSQKTADSVSKVVNDQKQQVLTQVLGVNNPPVIISVPASSIQELQGSGQDLIIVELAKNDQLIKLHKLKKEL